MSFIKEIKESIKLVRLNRLELPLVFIFAVEVLFPQHTAYAAQVVNFDAGPVIDRPQPAIPFRAQADIEADLDSESSVDLVVPAKAKQFFYITVTAYSSAPDQTDNSPYLTASQTFVREGVVASNYFRIGTKIRFPDLYGDRVFIVEDRMNRRYFKRVDIWMPERDQAVKFGLKRLKVEVVE